MSNWKKVSKKLLVLLLASSIISGMMDHSWVTALAANAEGEIRETEGLPEEEKISEETNTPDTAGEGTLKSEESPKAEGEGTPKSEDIPQAEGEGTLKSEESPKAEGEGAPEGEDVPQVEQEEGPKTENGPDTEGNTSDTQCICQVLCQEGESTECPVCREDPSKCSGKALTEESEADELTKEEEKPQDPAVAALKEQLSALPSLEELKNLDQEGQAGAYEEIQKAYDAYEALTEEQKALLPEAEEQLKELLVYFTELIAMPAATGEQVNAAREAMKTAMLNWTAELDLSSYNLTEENMKTIWPGVAEDNPDLFYVLGMNYTTLVSNGIVQKCTFAYNSQYTRDSVAEYKAAIAKVISEVIDNNMTPMEKALALHDYLVQHMVYDQNANNNLGIEKRNAYEALVNGIGVCQGYTLAYAALLREVGINVDYCKSTSMNHIWNYVELDGKWYHADLTYDDIAAASQTGETGYVRHTYFLLSDAAIRQIPTSGPHTWDSNSITCTDTTYDGSWHKTAPLSESAIYSTGGVSYYLVKKVAEGSTSVCAGATLMKRDANGTVSEVGSFLIENGWTPYMFTMCFSRLSQSKGVLYFNVGNSVYAFDPALNAAPEKIYAYSDDQKRIVTGLLVTGDKMTLEISSQAGAIQEKIEVPIFTLSATETKVKVGYTTAPVLSANPSATGFTWSKQNPDGSWATINGATGSSYTIETGLPEGSYRYRAEATLGGRTVSDEIVITVTAQEEQKNFAFPAGTKAVTYGDPDFTVTAQGAVAGSAVRYSSSDASVAAVDPVTGAVKILGAGSAVITATASETADYLEARSTYTLTVAPKGLSWDVSALEAKDRLDLIKDGATTLYGELKVAGILEKDAGTVKFECPADKLVGVYGTVAAGSQKVKLSWRDAQATAQLQGSGSGNYTLPAALPELTGQISVLDTSLPSLPESTDGKDFKVQVENGISRVPDAFQNIEHLNTPGKIENQMKLKIQESANKVPETNIVVYDVELLVNINGTGWQKATKENFPSTGLTVTLPYPSGTGRDTHDFVVAHMFTENMNGFGAGDVEYPAVTKTENGITFKVNGLSPVSVGWKDVEKSGYTGGGSTGGASSTNRVGAAATGDTAPVMLYVLLAVIGGVSAAVIGLYIRRKRSSR